MRRDPLPKRESSMTELDRRSFLKTSAAVAGGAALAGPFQGLLAARRSPSHTVLGACVPTCGTTMIRLHVPPGFSYRSFHDTEYPEQSTL